MKRELKRLFFQDSIREAGSDSAKLWKVLKRLLQNTTKRDQINSIDNLTNLIDIVNALNDYFTNVGANLANRIPTSDLELNFDNNPNIPLLELVETTPEEVRELLLGISDSKATGEDEIPVPFLKMAIDTTSNIICYIINLSFRTLTVPDKWKVALIAPIYKDGDRNLPNNYRPISILPVISKVMEKIVHKQVYEHLCTNKLMSETQVGFRKHHSTSTCIFKLLDSIYLNINKGLMTGVVFLNLKRAFDTVYRDILLSKLNTFNLSLRFISLF